MKRRPTLPGPARAKKPISEAALAVRTIIIMILIGGLFSACGGRPEPVLGAVGAALVFAAIGAVGHLSRRW
jgi:hypothetical protein